MRTLCPGRLFSILLLLCSFAATLCLAQEETPPKTSSYIKKSEIFNGVKPNLKAKFYVFLDSASWCGFCPPAMKAAVEEYPEMKRNGVELILVDFDKSLDMCKAYVKKYKVTFPAVFHKKAKTLDSFLSKKRRSGGVPNALFMDEYGKVIKDGHGTLVSKWKEILLGSGEEQGEDSPAAGKGVNDLLDTGRKVIKDTIGTFPLF